VRALSARQRLRQVASRKSERSAVPNLYFDDAFRLPYTARYLRREISSASPLRLSARLLGQALARRLGWPLHLSAADKSKVVSQCCHEGALLRPLRRRRFSNARRPTNYGASVGWSSALPLRCRVAESSLIATSAQADQLPRPRTRGCGLAKPTHPELVRCLLSLHALEQTRGCGH